MSSPGNPRYLVVAAFGDAAAWKFAASRPGIAVVTPRDLGRPGWVYEDGCAVSGCVGGMPFDPSALRGVIVRLPAVLSTDVPWIRAEDSAYAAAEMTAFLRGWLAALPCPVLNPITSDSLCGEADGIAVSRAAASLDGPDIVAWHHRTNSAVSVPVDVVGGVAVAGATSPAGSAAQIVARSIGMPLLRVWLDFGTSELQIRVDPWVALDQREVARVVLAELNGSQSRCRYAWPK